MKLNWLMDRADGVVFAEAVIPRLEAAGLPMGEVRSRKLRWGPELWVPKVEAIISAFQAGSPGNRRPL